MGKELEGLYVEGVAIHDGPESCVGAREGVGEVLTGVRAGWAIEPRNSCIRGADALQVAEGNTARRRFREPPAGPAGSVNLCMCVISPCARTGRSHGHPLVVMVGRVVRERPRP